MNGVIATGGHIDHGKTALVAALTGENTDRLPEEKRRGISIDLGFSRLEVDGVAHGIVDVPGHEDFIRNMLAGATGMDVLLLVVAADEGVMPQTREHVAIAELLDVPAAVVALTKADLVSDEWLDLARDDVATFLADTRFADAPILPVASPAGSGLDSIRAALALALGARRRPQDDLFRMPVDRAFTVKGTGTVVTGTVWSGALSADAVVRAEPGGLDARVRSFQIHGRDSDRIVAGQRAAIALTGADRADVARGATLVTEPAWNATSILTARLRVLAGTEWSIAQRQRVRVHLATAEVMARVRLLDAPRLDPGETGWAQLRLEAPIVARAGDRCVIRSYSPVTTIAGGLVAEPAALRRKRLDDEVVARLQARVGTDPAAAVSAVIEEAGATGAPLGRLPIEAGVTPADVEAAAAGEGIVVTGGLAFPAAAAATAREALRTAVDAHHERWPLRAGIDLETLRRAAVGAPALVQAALDELVTDGVLEARDGRIARAGFRPALDDVRRERAEAVLRALEEAGAAPPAADELAALAGPEPRAAEEILHFLEAEGRIARLQPGLYMHSDVVDRLTAAVKGRLGGRSGLGPADFRDVVAVSRKHLIPILEHFDLIGVTVRHDDGRSVPSS
ncbi:MAG TPA: selenocysteine-specific translation elongation factor [Longimicrobiales bacterium]|nr:selenocysteine-specific translation elongation factor [Longimicrobiales bacterium]